MPSCLQELKLPTFNPTNVFFPASLPDVYWPMETNDICQLWDPETFKDVSILLFRVPLTEVQLQQNIRWNIWNPKSWSWMVQMMFLFIIFGGWFSGWSSHQFVWGSEMIFPHKNQPKRTYPPKDLANSRPTMVWYGTPINRRKYVGFHWDRNNWRYNHYKWPYKWGSLGL